MGTAFPDRPSDHPPDHPVIRELAFASPLDPPPTDAPSRVPANGLDWITGGGLVALVDPSRGLRSLWSGEARATGGLGLRWNDRPLHPASGMRLDAVGWERRLALPGGGELVERAALLDSAPALVLFWTSSETGTLTLELGPAGGGPPLAASLRSSPEGMGVAVLPPGQDPDRLAPRLHPPAARARARRAARDGTTLRIDGSADLLAPARAALERAAVGPEREDGRPAGPFLLGIEDGEPRFAGGAALAEIGLGGLLAGRSASGWACLEALLAAPTPPLIPTLHLAAALAAWTGRTDRLATLREEIDVLAGRLSREAEAGRGAAGGGAPRTGAAFPGPARVLDRLASGVEPLGRGWSEELLARKAEIRREPAGPVRLPVLGARDEAPPAAPDAGASLPLPDAFAPLDAPGVAPRRTLHAARLVRAWVEGVLGAEPDAAYGRLRLAPDMRRVHEELRLQGLEVGGAPVRLDCRVAGPACRLRLLQEGGRLPLNLVFEPRLPLTPPLTVRIDGEPAEVTVHALDGGAALSFQLPLDPERRIVVEEGG